MKYIVLSGSSGGMGLETIRKFTMNGYYVFGLDINEPKEEFDNFMFIKTNLREQESITKAFETVNGVTGELDAIISMAGIYDLNSLIEMSEEDFIRIFDINVFAVYRLNKTFVPLLKKKGKVIITSSELAPLDPLPFNGIYSVTKKTVEAYAYSLRMELQLLDLQVSVIRPGAVNTSLIDVSTDRLDKFVNNTEHYQCNAQRFKKIVDDVEARKIPPERIANLAYKIVLKKKPRYVYKINRNPLLMLLGIMPKRFQNWVIKKILTKK